MKQFRGVIPVLGLFAVIGLANGCKPSTAEPGTVPVTGMVTLDGQPIAEGRITVHPPNGDGRSASAPIIEGKYQLNAEPGPKKVEIIANRVIPGKFDETTNPGVKEPLQEMYIPKMYNTETTLKMDVGSGTNEYPFELKSK